MNPVLAGAVVVYVLFLLFYAIWSLFLLYHLFRFAPHRSAALGGSVMFFGVTVMLLLVSFAYLASVPWSASFAFPLSGYGL